MSDLANSKKVVFDIGDLYGRVWNGLLFPELIRRNATKPGDYIGFGFGDKEQQTAFKNNQTGRPIQSQLTLRLNNEEMRFAIPPIITVQGSINVVETVVAGLDGSVKEITSVSDYALNIKGFLVNTDTEEVNSNGFKFRLNSQTFPEKELRQLRKFFEAKKALEVVESRLLSFFNVKKLLFKSLNFPEMEGYVSVIPFEAEAVSDREYTLILE